MDRRAPNELTGRGVEMPPELTRDPLLELEAVTAAYGRIQVLNGVDLAIPAGTVFALLGPNGGGKSTTLKVASCQMEPTSGRVKIAGRTVNGATSEQLAERGVCTIPEGRGIFANLTVRENLELATYTGKPLAAIEERTYSFFPRLAERRHQLAGTMSGGEQQMLSMARALSSDPVLLMLDELSMGLAPLVVEELYAVVSQVAGEGVSILVVEQFARTVLGVADWAAIMLGGCITRVGPPEELEHELTAAYLGDR